MPKLIKEILFEVFIETLDFNDEEKYNAFRNFMMSGKEPFNIALKWFSKQNFPDVSVNGKQWKFKTVMDPAHHCEKWLFDNFAFIKPISLKIAHCVLDLKLIHANVNDVPFLEDLEALESLKITTNSIGEFHEINAALKNLKAVKKLELNVPKSDSSLFDLITFEIESITFYSFMFEKKLKCKLRRDIKSAFFYGDKEFRRCFIFEPQHFANYLRKLPKVKDFYFDIHHTISDADTVALGILKDKFLKDIRHQMYGPRIFIYINYYNDEHILKSSMYKKLQKIAFCRCCPYDSPSGKTFYSNVYGFFQFDFTKKYEYVKSLWNEGMIHTPSIPPHFEHDEHIIIKVEDPFGNIILFKLYWDVPLKILCIYFANRVGIDHSDLRIFLCGRHIGWNDTPRRLQWTNNDIFEIVCAQFG